MADQQFQIITPSGGMNQDDSIVTPSRDAAGHSSFEGGDYRYALNARIGSSRDDDFGDLEILRDTVEVTSYFIRQFGEWVSGTKPSGTEKVIGKYEDVEFQRLYFAVYNSNNNHCLRYYDPITNAIYELLKWSGLKFQPTYFVKMAKLDNWLAFTDRNNAPRLMDTRTISDLFNDLTITNFREFHISFHKWAPVMPPILYSFYDGVTNNHDKLKEKVYPFSYRYIYYGGMRSRWSPISIWGDPTDSLSGGITTGRITSINISIPGFILDNPDANIQYNYFNHTDIKFYRAVEFVEIAYKDSALDIWRLYKRLTTQPSPAVSEFFTGESDSTPIAVDDFEQPFDTVPFQAGTVEAIDNRFVFGDCLDEQPSADPVSVTNVAVIQNSTGSIGWESNVKTSFSGMTSAQAFDVARHNDLMDRSLKSRGIYKLAIQYLHHTGWKSLGYTSNDLTFLIPATPANASTAITESRNAFTFKFPDSFKPPSWAVAYQILRTNCLNIDAFMFGVVNRFIPIIDDPSAIIDKSTLPQSTKDRIRQHFENSRIVNGYDVVKEVNAEIQKLESTGRGLSSYLASNLLYHKLGPEVRKTSNPTGLLVSDCSRIYIDINNWYNASKKNATGTTNNPLNKFYYNYREPSGIISGDRVRFTASNVASPTLASQLQIYDAQILEFTGQGIIIERPVDVLWLPLDNEAGIAGFKHVIEVYTPKVSDEKDFIYYETGEWFPVLFPGSISKDWSKKDWTWTNLAAVTCVTYGGVYNVPSKLPFFNGDCHSFSRIHYSDFVTGRIGNSSYATISMSPIKDQTYGFWEKCNGRPAVTYSTLPLAVATFKATQLRFGGKIIELSFVNALNRFRDDDQFIYPSEYGRIRGLINTSNAQVESVGSILLAIGEREAWSIYVNRTTLEDLGGNTQVSLSDKVLGSYNTLLGSHGTMNPESVSKYRGRVYWWDAINGSWIRYGRDGITAVSDYKMRNWFKDISSLLITKYSTSEIPVAISDYDPFNEELVSFINHSTLPSTFRGYDTYKGAMFSESDTKWKSIHSYDPEMFGKLNNQLISFRTGSLFLHEAGTSYNSFYGIKRDVMIEPVFNQEPNQIKSWQTFSIIATAKWSVERFNSEFRGTKSLQLSSIPLSLFQNIEDTYRANIRQDSNSTGGIINGDKMRSKAIKALMKLDPTIVTRSLLHYVMAGYIDSYKKP